MGKRYNYKKFILSRNFKYVSIGFIILLTTVFLIQMFSKAYRGDGIDYTSYLLSSKAFLNGNNPYHTGSPFIYIYPLFLTSVLIPLTVLPYWLSLLIWFFIGVLSFYFSIVIILKLKKDEINIGQSQASVLLIFLLVIFLSNILQNNLLNGQINIIVMLLCILFFYFFIENKLIIASAFLAIAISIKIVPVIFLIISFRKKNFPLLLYTFLFVFALCILLPYLINGVNIFEYYHDYLNEFILSKINSNPLITKQSLFFTFYGFIIYLFPSLIKIKLLQTICSFLVIISVAAIYYKSPIVKLERNAPYVMSLLFLSILLINPMSETHHLIFILPAVCLIFSNFIFNQNDKDRKATILLLLFIITFWTGNFLKLGIYYFISLVCLYILLIYNISWEVKIEKI